MSLIYLVRHGETQDNREERLQGRKDTPLNEQGRNQARALSAYFANKSLAGIVASPLQRAKQTAVILAEARVCIFEEPGFIARRLGEFEGLTVAELKARSMQEYLALKNDFEYCPPKGESAAMLLARSLPRLHYWVGYFDALDFAIVTHAIVIKVLLHHSAGFPFDRLPITNSNTAIHILEGDPTGIHYRGTEYPVSNALKSGME